jgi:hypothetical protein
MEQALCLGAIVLMVVAVVYSNNEKQRRLDEARRAYFEHLESLKKSPNDPNLKQQTLQLGRRYSALTRESNGVTVYDEMAIMNDISAATAAATASVPTRATIAPAPTSIEERLRKLEELKNRELITMEEYRTRREAILRDI